MLTAENRCHGNGANFGEKPSSTTSLDRCSALERRLIRRKWSRILRLFESESDKIGAQRPAFAFQEPLYAGFSAGSPVLNEVVLEGFSPKFAPLPWHRFSAVSMPSGAPGE